MADELTGIKEFEDLIDGLDHLFWVIDYPAEERTIYSGSLLKLTGYTAEEISALDQKYLAIVHEEDRESYNKLLNELALNSLINFTEVSYRIMSKDGTPIWLKELLKIERQSDSTISKIIKISVCIDDLKKHNDGLESSIHQLEELNTAKDRFISIVSHDLRSPFATLLGFTDILLQEKDLPEEERIEYLTYINEASKTQLNLINQLIDWSRLQTGKIKPEITRLNLKMLLQNIGNMWLAESTRKRIDIKLDVASEISITADERLITQALSNFLSNAIRFTEEGKKIYISAGKFKKGIIEIIFKDEGVGIAEENHSKLFNINEKFCLPNTKGEKGSGLGLAIAKEIIDKHCGEIWLYSKLNEGSEFHITLLEAKNTIMVVEDDAALRALYRHKISESIPNIEVILADNGYHAISLIIDDLPSMIITDHDMPFMNGIQLVEAIRKKDISYSVPIIVISAKLNDEIKNKYLQIGVNDVISKPVNLDELVKLIKTTLN
jgi:PAS domain S-box-containing protein